jgi:hypothetical protein
MIARAAIVLVVAGIIAFQALRTATVHERGSDLAARLWPGHPQVMTARAMADLGVAAARGEGVPPELLDRFHSIARRAPLAPEPFLVSGAMAQMRGLDPLAEQIFRAAVVRDPRSEAARYFLADRYLRTGRTSLALSEMAMLSRLLPEASLQFGPALASYARSRGAVDELKQFFLRSPEFEPVVLSELASDPQNAELVLDLWSGQTIDEPPNPDWRSALVNSLVERGDYIDARRIWARLSNANASRHELHNAAFADDAAPAPFNWSFGSKGGVAEPLGNGRLQVIYYGREDATLAEQLLVLPAGRYVLNFEASGDFGSAAPLEWRLRCVPDGPTIMSAPLAPLRRGGKRATAFRVPGGCSAQRLELAGIAGESPSSTTIEISRLRLTRAR